MMTKISYRRISLSTRDHPHAIWLYVRFTLSFRNIEDLQKEQACSPEIDCVRAKALENAIVVAVLITPRRGSRTSAQSDIKQDLQRYRDPRPSQRSL
jgi:hypothetical protein